MAIRKAPYPISEKSFFVRNFTRKSENVKKKISYPLALEGIIGITYLPNKEYTLFAILAEASGLEPEISVLETIVLPLKLYLYMAGVVGFEPTDARIKIWCLNRLATPQYIFGEKFPVSHRYFTRYHLILCYRTFFRQAVPLSFSPYPEFLLED